MTITEALTLKTGDTVTVRGLSGYHRVMGITQGMYNGRARRIVATLINKEGYERTRLHSLLTKHNHPPASFLMAVDRVCESRRVVQDALDKLPTLDGGQP